jgi:uncharacterized membrane protein YcjF (UPF0283 family)
MTLASLSTFAQGLAPAAKQTKSDKRTAQALYEDANGYLGRKYQEFNKQKLPYDPKLEAQTKKEQKELAVKNAATLQSRSSLKGDDLYYLGMLHHLAGDADAALAAMRLLLKDDPDGQKAQAARNVVVLYSVKKISRRSERCSRSVRSSSTTERGRSLSHGASDHGCVPARERLPSMTRTRSKCSKRRRSLLKRTKAKFSGAMRCC